MKIPKKILFAAFAFSLMSSVTAQQPAPKQFAVGAHLGSLGLGLHGHYQPTQLISGTAYVETLQVSVEQRQAIANDPASVLKADSNVLMASTNLNLHPFGSGFRISGGLTFGKPELSGNSSYDSNDISNNDGTISYTIGAANAVQPYAGIGYSAYRGGNNRFYFHGDLGALFVGSYEGSATANLNCGAKAPIQKAICEVEQATVQNQASNEATKAADKGPKIYPVVRVGLGIKF